jgi:hypothetical protein
MIKDLVSILTMEQVNCEIEVDVGGEAGMEIR